MVLVKECYLAIRYSRSRSPPLVLSRLSVPITPKEKNEPNYVCVSTGQQSLKFPCVIFFVAQRPSFPVLPILSQPFHASRSSTALDAGQGAPLETAPQPIGRVIYCLATPTPNAKTGVVLQPAVASKNRTSLQMISADDIAAQSSNAASRSG